MIISFKVFIIQIVFLYFWNKKKDSIQSSFIFSFFLFVNHLLLHLKFEQLKLTTTYLPRSVSENKKGGKIHILHDIKFSHHYLC